MIGFRRDVKPASWAEVRKVLVSALLAAALLHLGAPMLSMAKTVDSIAWYEAFLYFFSNVNPVTGLLVLAAAVVACTVPIGEKVSGLRRVVRWSAVFTAAIAALSIGHAMTLPVPSATSELDALSQRVVVVMWRSGPALVLAVAAEWTARRAEAEAVN